MKIDFIDDNNFVVYYLSEIEIRTEEELKLCFKDINQALIKLYDYQFSGFYNVNIYCCSNLYVMNFENIDDYGRADFNITMVLNSTMLCEFDDFELFSGNKVYYNDKFYVELDDVVNDIRLFEYGNIIYGDEVDKILNRGILFTV